MEYALNGEEAKAVQIKLEELEKSKNKRDNIVPHLSESTKKALGLIDY